MTRVFVSRNVLSSRKCQNLKVNIFQNLVWLILAQFLWGPASVPRAQGLDFTNTTESTNSYIIIIIIIIVRLEVKGAF